MNDDKILFHDNDKSLFIAASRVIKAYDWIEYYDILEVEYLKQHPSYFILKNQFDNTENSANFIPFLKKITTLKKICNEKNKTCTDKVITFNATRDKCRERKINNLTFNYRAWYCITPELQIFWTSAATYLSQIFEPHMSQPDEDNNTNKVFSYGNRFIKKWSKVDKEWKNEGLNIYSDLIYEPFNRGYTVFKRHIEKKAQDLTKDNHKACFIKSDLSGFYPSVTHENFMLSIEKTLEFVPLEAHHVRNVKDISKQLKFKVPLESQRDEYKQLNGMQDEYKHLSETVLPIGLHVAGLFSNIFFLAIEIQLTQFMKNEEIEDVFIFRYVDDVIFLSTSNKNLNNVYEKYSELCERYGLKENMDKKEEGYVDQYNLKPFLTGILDRLSNIGKKVLPALPQREHNNTVDELINFLETDFADHEIRPDTKDSFIISKIVNTPFSAHEIEKENNENNNKRLQKISKAILLAIDSHPYKYALYKRYLEFIFKYSATNYQQTFYLNKFTKLLKDKIFKYANSDEKKYVDFIKMSLLHYTTLQLIKNYRNTNVKIAKYLAKVLGVFEEETISQYEIDAFNRCILLLKLLCKEVEIEKVYNDFKNENEVLSRSLLFFIPDEMKNDAYIEICKSLLQNKDIKRYPFLLKLFMSETVINQLSTNDLNMINEQMLKVEG